MKDKDKIIQTAFLFSIFLAQLRAFCTKIIFIAPLIPIIEKGLFFLLIAISIYNFFASKFKAKEFILVVALLILAVISYLVTDSLTISYLLLLPFAAKGIDFKKIIKADLISKITITLTIFGCYFMNLVETRIFYRDGLVRESFGFAHPNTLGYISIIIYLDILFLLNKNNTSIIARILTAVIPLYFCQLADSRTSQLAILFALAFSILEVLRRRKKNSKKKKTNILFRKAIYILPVVLALFSFVSTRAYHDRKEWAVRLNETLSTRLYLQDYYEKHHEVSLLGEKLTSDHLQKKPLDNGYYRILFNNGLLGLIALMSIIEIALAKSLNSKRNISFILILLLVYGLSEWTVFRVIITPFWTIAFAKEEQDEKEIPSKLA